MVGLRKVNRDEEEAATINGCKFLKACEHDGSNKQMKHTATKKNKEVDWSVSLGVSQRFFFLCATDGQARGGQARASRPSALCPFHSKSSPNLGW